jgi:hypothetical protein
MPASASARVLNRLVPTAVNLVVVGAAYRQSCTSSLLRPARHKLGRCLRTRSSRERHCQRNKRARRFIAVSLVAPSQLPNKFNVPTCWRRGTSETRMADRAVTGCPCSVGVEPRGRLGRSFGPRGYNRRLRIRCVHSHNRCFLTIRRAQNDLNRDARSHCRGPRAPATLGCSALLRFSSSAAWR